MLPALERAGEVLVTCIALIFAEFNIGRLTPWSMWLFAAAVLLGIGHIGIHWNYYKEL